MHRIHRPPFMHDGGCITIIHVPAVAGGQAGQGAQARRHAARRPHGQSRLSDEGVQCRGLVQIAHKLDLLLGGYDALVGKDLQQILEYRLLFRGHST